MPKLLSVLLLWMVLAGCSSIHTVSGKTQMGIVLKNNSDHTIRLKAGSGLFTRTIQLEPGERWDGYVPTAFLPDEIVVEALVPKHK